MSYTIAQILYSTDCHVAAGGVPGVRGGDRLPRLLLDGHPHPHAPRQADAQGGQPMGLCRVCTSKNVSFIWNENCKTLRLRPSIL